MSWAKERSLWLPRKLNFHGFWRRERRALKGKLPSQPVPPPGNWPDRNNRESALVWSHCSERRPCCKHNPGSPSLSPAPLCPQYRQEAPSVPAFPATYLSPRTASQCPDWHSHLGRKEGTEKHEGTDRLLPNTRWAQGPPQECGTGGMCGSRGSLPPCAEGF